MSAFRKTFSGRPADLEAEAEPGSMSFFAFGKRRSLSTKGRRESKKSPSLNWSSGPSPQVVKLEGDVATLTKQLAAAKVEMQTETEKRDARIAADNVRAQEHEQCITRLESSAIAKEKALYAANEASKKANAVLVKRDAEVKELKRELVSKDMAVVESGKEIDDLKFQNRAKPVRELAKVIVCVGAGAVAVLAASSR